MWTGLFALVWVAQVPGPGPSGPLRKMAVLPTQVDATATGQVPKLFDEVVLAAVQNTGAYQVIGQDDIQAILGFEKQKDLLACEESTCLADIGGALGVDKLLVFKVARVGSDWVSTAKIIDTKTLVVESRSSDFVAGDVKALIGAMPTIVKKLLAGGGVATLPTPTPPPAAVAPGPKTVMGGTLIIESRPAGMDCLVGGQKQGTTPCELVLPGGRYDVAVEHPHFETERLEARVTTGRVNRLPPLVMTPRPVPVTIVTQPVGARVEIDGREVGRTETKLELAPGSHTLRLELPGHNDVLADPQIALGKAQTLEFVLTPGLSGPELSARSRNSFFRWSTAVLAAAALGVGIWQGVAAKDIDTEITGMQASDPATLDRVGDGERAALIADISFGTAGGMALISTLLWIFAD